MTRAGPGRRQRLGLIASAVLWASAAAAQSEPTEPSQVTPTVMAPLCDVSGACSLWGLRFSVTPAPPNGAGSEGHPEIVRRRAMVLDRMMLRAMSRNPNGSVLDPVNGPRFDSMNGTGEPDLRMRPARD